MRWHAIHALVWMLIRHARCFLQRDHIRPCMGNCDRLEPYIFLIGPLRAGDVVRRAHETDQAAGDIDWTICYDDLYVSATAEGQVSAVDCPGRCNRYVYSRAVISV